MESDPNAEAGSGDPVDSLVDRILSEACSVLTAKSTLTSEMLLKLTDLFGAELLRSCLELLDDPAAEIIRIVAEKSGRTVNMESGHHAAPSAHC